MTVRREEIPFQFVDPTPGARAQADQMHATAMQMLRQADWYVLTVAYVDEEGRNVTKAIAGGVGDQRVFRDTLVVAAIEAGQMALAIPREEES